MITLVKLIRFFFVKSPTFIYYTAFCGGFQGEAIAALRAFDTAGGNQRQSRHAVIVAFTPSFPGDATPAIFIPLIDIAMFISPLIRTGFLIPEDIPLG